MGTCFVLELIEDEHCFFKPEVLEVKPKKQPQQELANGGLN